MLGTQSNVAGSYRWSNPIRRTIEQNVQDRKQGDTKQRTILYRTGKPNVWST